MRFFRCRRLEESLRKLRSLLLFAFKTAEGSDVADRVKDERSNHKSDGDNNADKRHGGRYILPENMHDRHGVNRDGCGFSVPLRAVRRAGACDNHKSEYARNKFLDDQKSERKPDFRKRADKTEHYADLRKFVRDRVERLAERANHIELTRYDAVYNVGYAAYDDDYGCRDESSGQILPDEKRNKQESYCCEDIGDSNNSFVVIFIHSVLRLRRT